jgi:hypothetical protein
MNDIIEKVVANTGVVPKESVLDGGYFSGKGVDKAEKNGFEVLVNIPNFSSTKNGKILPEFDKPKFVYDEFTDTYTCPLGEILRRDGKKNSKDSETITHKYRCVKCKSCPFRQLCTSDSKGRSINRTEYEAAVERQKKKQENEENRAKLRARKSIVERVFSYLKEVFGLRRWSVRGMKMVKTQWSLACTAYNLVVLQKLTLQDELS